MWAEENRTTFFFCLQPGYTLDKHPERKKKALWRKETKKGHLVLLSPVPV